MNLLEYFKNKKKCHHDKVTPDKDICYCPDCGELIENRWYITRCSCCGVKLKAIVKDGKIITARSAASSIDFAFKIMEVIKGKEVEEKIKKQIYY